jgi:hypothetical protein
MCTEGEKEYFHTRHLLMSIWKDTMFPYNSDREQFQHPLVVKEVGIGVKEVEKLIPEKLHGYIQYEIRTTPGHDNMDVNKYFAIDFYLELV